jgi:L-methionine (R)-S-oxide reductase
MYMKHGEVYKQYIGSEYSQFESLLDDLEKASLDDLPAGDTTVVGKVAGAGEGTEPAIPAISEIIPASYQPSSRYFEYYGGVRTVIPPVTFDLLAKLGLEQLRVSAADVAAVKGGLDQLSAIDANVDLTTLTAADVESLYVYQVPLLGPGGTCSISHSLSIRPFNLAIHAYKISPSPEMLMTHPQTRRLLYLKHVVTRLNALVLANWIGIYRLVEADGEPALLKESYLGEHSRAVFPVTITFAAKSTNSWVGLTGNARIIANTQARDGEVSYYECSSKVQSELCVPIYGKPSAATGASSVIGIIDLESWNSDHFTGSRVMQALQAAFEIGAANFGFDL